MPREEVVERLERISEYAVHRLGEPLRIMSLDDGIAVCEAVKILKSEQSMIDRVLEIIKRKEKGIGQLHSREKEIYNLGWVSCAQQIGKEVDTLWRDEE